MSGAYHSWPARSKHPHAPCTRVPHPPLHFDGSSHLLPWRQAARAVWRQGTQQRAVPGCSLPPSTTTTTRFAFRMVLAGLRFHAAGHKLLAIHAYRWGTGGGLWLSAGGAGLVLNGLVLLPWPRLVPRPLAWLRQTLQPALQQICATVLSEQRVVPSPRPTVAPP